MLLCIISPHLFVASLSQAFNIFVLFVRTLKNFEKKPIYPKSILFLINLFFFISNKVELLLNLF